MLKRLWREDEGILTFEWILLLTLLVIGVIGGVAGIRDAIIHECQGVVGAMMGLDQSYTVAPPLAVSVSSYGGGGCATSTASFSDFRDSASWADGRISATSLVGTIAQQYSQGGNLCPVTAN
jgi:Flp pilus assembly pilin Flp